MDLFPISQKIVSSLKLSHTNHQIIRISYKVQFHLHLKTIHYKQQILYSFFIHYTFKHKSLLSLTHQFNCSRIVVLSRGFINFFGQTFHEQFFIFVQNKLMIVASQFFHILSDQFISKGIIIQQSQVFINKSMTQTSKKIQKINLEQSSQIGEQLSNNMSDMSWINQFNQQTKILGSTSIWPNSPQLKKQLNIPLCLALNPFEISEVADASFKKQQLRSYRCVSCKAFINKLCIFKTSKNYDCSICGASNKLEKEFDIQSTEYRKMVYECEASSQNYVKIVSAPTIIFVIDVSKNAFESGFLVNLKFALKQFIKNIENKHFFQIMIITFDKYVHYYDLKAEELKRIILCDTQCEKNIYILDQVQLKILQIIESLEDIAKNNNYNNQSILKAIQLAYSVSRNYAGRILIFSALQRKFAQSTAISDSLNITLIENHRFLEQKFSKQLKESLMSISFFIFSNTFINLIEFYMLTKITNGSLHHYSKNQLLKFYYELSTLLLQTDYYEVILKVRYSPGVRLMAIFGSYSKSKVSDQISLFTCSSNRNYVLEFDIQGKINSKYINIQFTLLFANRNNQRKFRIINHLIKMQQDPSIILNNIDYSMVNYYYLKAGCQSLDGRFQKKNIKQIIQQRCSNHLKYILQRQGKIDKKLSQYTALTFSFLKSKLLNMQYQEALQYEKIVEMRSIFLRSAYKQLLLRIYPFFYGIQKYQAEQQSSLSIMNLQQQQQCLLDPKQGSLNIYNILLIDKGDQLLLYLNKNSKSIYKIFGEQKNIQNLNEEKLKMIESSQIIKLVKIIQKLRIEKQNSYQNLRFVSKIDKSLVFSEQGTQNYTNFVDLLVK